MQYRVKVIPGKGRGKKIGVPTYNFTVPDNLAIKHGVYAGWLCVNDKLYPAAIHFGPRPTFFDQQITLQIHLITNNLPLSFKEAKIEFASFIRPIKTFPTAGAMVVQIKKRHRGNKT